MFLGRKPSDNTRQFSHRPRHHFAPEVYRPGDRGCSGARRASEVLRELVLGQRRHGSVSSALPALVETARVSTVDELPYGTVTFLFTDIEGSTQLLKQLGGDRYGEALDDHQRILREAFAAHGGHEIDTQGDSFFVAFRRAKDAVACAIACSARPRRARVARRQRAPRAHGHPHRRAGGRRRALRRHGRPPGGAHLRGRPRRPGARLADDARAPRATIRSPDVTVRDLGEHQLKDMAEPERIFQLVVPGTARRTSPH